jgi:CheY-like chemotaxis protein
VSAPPWRVTAYAGARRKILIADDDADHVRLVSDVLLPLGFIVLGASDGASCLAMVDDAAPDLVILDITMPGMSGLEVAAAMRARGAVAKILMVSGNLHEAAAHHVADYDAFLAKPIDLRALLERIGSLLALDWVKEVPAAKMSPAILALPDAGHLADLLKLVRIGYVRGIEAKLAELEMEAPALAPFCAQLRGWLRGFELQKLAAYLDALPELNA